MNWQIGQTFLTSFSGYNFFKRFTESLELPPFSTACNQTQLIAGLNES